MSQRVCIHYPFDELYPQLGDDKVWLDTDSSSPAFPLLLLFAESRRSMGGSVALTPPFPCSHFFFLSASLIFVPAGLAFFFGSTTTVPYSPSPSSSSSSPSLFGAFSSKLRLLAEF